MLRACLGKKKGVVVMRKEGTKNEGKERGGEARERKGGREGRERENEYILAAISLLRGI